MIVVRARERRFLKQPGCSWDYHVPSALALSQSSLGVVKVEPGAQVALLLLERKRAKPRRQVAQHAEGYSPVRHGPLGCAMAPSSATPVAFRHVKKVDPCTRRSRAGTWHVSCFGLSCPSQAEPKRKVNPVLV